MEKIAGTNQQKWLIISYLIGTRRNRLMEKGMNEESASIRIWVWNGAIE